MHFVGLQQFRFLWTTPSSGMSIRNTLHLGPVHRPDALPGAGARGAAELRRPVQAAFYRVAFFMPNVTSLVAIAIFFGSVFSNNFGLVNAILQACAASRAVAWLSNPWTIKMVIALLMTWQWTGYNAIIYLAGLQAIPTRAVRGRQGWTAPGPVQIFFRITVPMLRPIILFTVIISTDQRPAELHRAAGAVRQRRRPTATRRPRPGRPDHVLYFYQQAFDNNDFGYGAAIVWALFLLIAAVRPSSTGAWCSEGATACATTGPADTGEAGRRSRRRLGGLIAATACSLGVLISVFPFYWIVVMATNTTQDIYSYPPKLTLRHPPAGQHPARCSTTSTSSGRCSTR